MTQQAKEQAPSSHITDAGAPVAVTDVRFEHLRDALGIGTSQPRLSWDEDTSRPQPSPMLRREFSVKIGLRKARLYITALGVYDAEINGTPVGDHVLDPGWTSYTHRLVYHTYDVKSLLREGQNAIGAVL